MNEPPLDDLTTKELAALWKLGERSIRRLVSDHGLPVVRMRRSVRFDVLAVKKWRVGHLQKLNDLLNLTAGSRKAVAKGLDAGLSNGIDHLPPMKLASETCKIGFSKSVGLFYGSVRNPETGKTKTKHCPKSIVNETDARSWLMRYEAEEHAKHGVEVKASAPAHTLATLLPLWADYLRDEKTTKKGKPLERSTRVGMLGCLSNHALTQKIGKLPMTTASFTAFAVLDWVSYLKKNLDSTYYVISCVQALRTLITDARKKQWIDLPYNPADDGMVKSEVPTGEPLSGKDNPIHLAKADAITLISKNPPNGNEIDFTRRCAELVAICTGLRQRELQALAWRHIDFAEETIEVERQMASQGKAPNKRKIDQGTWGEVDDASTFPTFKVPKKGSHRILPMHPLVKQALLELKRRLSPDAEDPVIGHVNDPKRFAMWAHSPATAANLRTDMTLMGISTLYDGEFDFDFHATRRTFLTLLTNEGVSDSDVGALAGHAQKGVKKHYVKLHIARFKEVIRKLPFEGLKLEWCKPHLKIAGVA